jgi:hypothetical protein
LAPTDEENSMRHLEIERPIRNRVTAVFDDGALSFDLAPAATLADLAARLAHLHGRRDRALISVAVVICPGMNAHAANGEGRDREPRHIGKE